MSEDLLAPIATLGIIVVMFAWVPLLKLICPPCISYLQSRRRRLPIARPTSFSNNRKAA